MIGIIGGGITGLTIAHHLRRASMEHVVLESSSEPGGVIRSLDRQGVPAELGPQRTRLTPSVAELVHELDLEDQLITAAPGLPLFVYRKGRLRRVPFTPAAALRTDALSLLGKLRVALEPLTAGVRPDSDETVASYFRRKLGNEAYQALAGPLYGGLYASDPAKMLVRHGLARTLERLGVERSLLAAWVRAGRRVAPDACSFRDGMAVLPDALHAANAENVRLDTHVTRIVKDAGEGYKIVTVTETVSVRQVVLTVPASAAADLLRTVAPGAAQALTRLTYNRLAVVHLESLAPVEGFGYQVAFGEPLETRGVTWNQSLFGRPRLSTAFLGGMKNPGIVNEPDDVLGTVAAAEFETVVGMDAEPVHVHRTWMPAWDRTWTHVEDLALPPGIRICSNYLSRPGIPGRLSEASSVAAELIG